MRILQVNTGHGWSGGQNQVLLLSRGLKERGHEVIVACTPGSRLAARCRDAGVHVQEVAMPSEFSFTAVRSLVHIMRGNGIEVVHAHKPKPFTLCAMACHIHKTPILVISRRVSFPVGRNVFGRLKWKYMRKDGVIAVSKSIKDDLVQFGIPSSRIKVVYSGTDTSRFDPRLDASRVKREFGIPETSNMILSLGNYFAWKGHLDLIQAIPAILEAFPETHVLIAGNDPPDFRRKMERLADHLKIRHVLHLPGPRDDVPHLLAACAMLVTIATRGEGLAGVIREAFLMQKPVIASDIGGNGELVANDQTGWLIPPNDVPQLVRAVCRVLDNPEKASSMAMEGRRRVEADFTHHIMIRETESFYRHLQDRGSHHG